MKRLLRQRDWCEGDRLANGPTLLVRGVPAARSWRCGAFDRRGSLRDFLRPEPARSLRSRPDTGKIVPLLVDAHLGVRQHRQSGSELVHVGALGMTSAGADRGVSGGAGARAVSRTRKHEIDQIALRSFDVLGVVLIAWQSWNRDPEIELLKVCARDGLFLSQTLIY